MKKLLVGSLWVVGSLYTQAQTVPVSPSGGAVTLEPGAGTVQPSTAGSAANPATEPSATKVGTPGLPVADFFVNGFGRFGDPMLESLIQLGLTNSPNLRAALSRLEEARVQVRIAQSFLRPSIRSSALVTTQSLSEQRPIAIPTAGDRLPRFQLSTFQLLPVDATYELDLFKRIRGGITVADLQAQASDADYRAFRLTLASDIARTYLLIRGNDAEQAIFTRNLLTRDTTLSILRERYRVGLINQIDVQRAETDYAGLRVTQQGLQRARVELVNGLAQLCGQDSATFSVPPGTLPGTTPTFPYATLPTELLLRRPDLQQFARQVQVSDAQAVVQQATTRPRVNLVGSGGLLSGRFGSWFVPGSATYLVGVNASIPLYEGRRNRELVALARQQVQTGQQTYQQQLQVAQREAKTALDNVAWLREQIALQEQAIALARRTEQYNRELYIRGLATFLEVLDSQRTVLANEQQLAQLRSQEVQFAVALLRAVGGDW